MTQESDDIQTRFRRERRDEAVIDLIIEAREELKRLDKTLDTRATAQTFHAFQRIFSYLAQALEVLMKGAGE